MIKLQDDFNLKLVKYEQTGFSLIELMITMLIIGILFSIAWIQTGYFTEKAEGSRMQITKSGATTALVVGVDDWVDEVNGIIWTSWAGGPMTGQLAKLLPGAVVSKNLRVGISYQFCPANAPSWYAYDLIVQSCKKDLQIIKKQSCDGSKIDIPLHSVDIEPCP